MKEVCSERSVQGVTAGLLEKKIDLSTVTKLVVEKLLITSESMSELEKYTSLREVHFLNCKFSHDVNLGRFKHFTLLESMVVTKTEWTGIKAIQLTRALSECKRMVNLSLSGSELVGYNFSGFTECLRAISNLSSLILTACNLNSAKGKHLADFLVDNHTITYLNLSENPIGTEGLKSIVGIFRTNVTLKKVELQDIGAGHVILDRLLPSLKSSRLERLFFDVQTGRNIQVGASLFFSSVNLRFVSMKIHQFFVKKGNLSGLFHKVRQAGNEVRLEGGCIVFEKPNLPAEAGLLGLENVLRIDTPWDLPCLFDEVEEV